MQGQGHAGQGGRVQGIEDSLRDKEGQVQHQEDFQDEGYASKRGSASPIRSKATRHPSNHKVVPGDECREDGAEAKRPPDENAGELLRLVEQNGQLLERLHVFEEVHADVVEELNAKHASEISALKSQHEAQMQQIIAREQDRYEKLQRSHAEHIQRLLSQPSKDEGYESRAFTTGGADARPPEAAVRKYLGSFGLVGNSTPSSARLGGPGSISRSHGPRWSKKPSPRWQARPWAKPREAEQWKDIIFIAIATLLLYPHGYATIPGTFLDRGERHPHLPSLFLAVLWVFLLRPLLFSMAWVMQMTSEDIPPCCGRRRPAGILLSVQQVAQALWRLAWLPSSLAFNIASTRLVSARWKTWVGCLNFLSWLKSRRRKQGTVTVAWTCKCGKRLRLAVREEHRQGAVAFAAQAAGPSQQHTIQVTPPPTPSPSTSPGSESDSQSLASSTRPGTTTTSHSSAPSISSAGDGDSLDYRPAPKGTPRFLLVCVKRGPGLIVPSALNLTDVIHDTTMFQRIRDVYYGSKPVGPGRWYYMATRHCWDWLRRFFLVPRTVQYVKFQLIRLQKSGTRVGSYETGQIPSVKQVYNMEYSYRPCPLDIGPYPLDPSIFMHWFLDPGDHADDPSMAVERLPKKLHSSLEDDMMRNTGNIAGGSGPPPIGWGIYIVEGLNWAKIQVGVLALLLATFLLSVIWSSTKEDVQGGMGIGQYLIALIVAVLTVSLLGFTPLEDLARGPEYKK